MFLIGPIDADIGATWAVGGCSETDSFIVKPFLSRAGYWEFARPESEANSL
jgi:hypothetical protein